jgi:hypothetical protein
MVLSTHALARSRHDLKRQKCKEGRGHHADVPGSDLAAGGAGQKSGLGLDDYNDGRIAGGTSLARKILRLIGSTYEEFE